MKLKIDNKDVSLFVNGKEQSKLAKKAKLMDKNLSADTVVKKAKEKGLV